MNIKKTLKKVFNPELVDNTAKQIAIGMNHPNVRKARRIIKQGWQKALDKLDEITK